MELRKLSMERYKGYAEAAELELAPLTILVGANNAGKTALAQAIQLLAGGLLSSESDRSEPLPLKSGGINHGETFEDLVTGRTAHGRLYMSATFATDTTELSLSAAVRSVVAPPDLSERQISKWSLSSHAGKISAERQGFDQQSPYKIYLSGQEQGSQPISWRGLIPERTGGLPGWIDVQSRLLRAWAAGVRHLRCPRYLSGSPFTTADTPHAVIGPVGQGTPLVLAANDQLRDSVREWYHNAFGVSIDVFAQGIYRELMTREPARHANVPLIQAGRGLSHVLPVVATAFTAPTAGPGVDIIEHPEAELHPGAHAHIAELLLDNLAGPTRPLVIETHSEMVLLRARRWVAERRLSASDVLVYWVHAEPDRGSVLQKIRIDENGELESWPDGVFIEDYEEILAIRRAARSVDSLD